MEVKSGRVDWLFATPPTPEVLGRFPSFDDFAPALQVFRDSLLPWVDGKEDIKRVAVGAVLTFGVADRIVGYRELQNLLPALTIDVERSSDLHYQINRHATSAVVPPLHINRLSNWGVVMARVAEMQIGPGGPAFVLGSTEAAVSAIRAQIDVNTDANRAESLPSGTMRPLVDELIGYCERIATEGDVA